MDTLGAVTINSVLMHVDGAWNVLNPQVLWLPTAEKGENRKKPRARGRRPNPWRTDESTYSLNMVIDGTFDVGANAYSTSPWVGLQHNIEYLWDNVVIPPDSPTTTRSLTLGMPDGDTRTGSCQPKHLETEPTESPLFTAVLTVYVPGGLLDPAGS